MENFKGPPQNINPIEIKKDKYQDLVNDFGMFITLNASKLEQQILSGKEGELLELRSNLRKPIINGLNYSDFTSKKVNKLTDPTVSQAIISQIYNFLQYIEPRLNIFKPDSAWVKRFGEVKNKYVDLVSSKS
jgi:hypothetical protein